MPPNPAPTKTPVKGKLGGIPTWGWVIGGVLGLIIGYMIIRKQSSGVSSATESSGSGSSPLGSSDSGSGGGVASPPPIIIQSGGGNNIPATSPPSGPTDIAPNSSPTDTGITSSVDITPSTTIGGELILPWQQPTYPGGPIDNPWAPSGSITPPFESPSYPGGPTNPWAPGGSVTSPISSTPTTSPSNVDEGNVTTHGFV